MQERMQCLELGTMPSSIAVLLQDELADSCHPGGEGTASAPASVQGGGGGDSGLVWKPAHVEPAAVTFDALTGTSHHSK